VSVLTHAALPAVFADRQADRGFESLAVAPDGRTL
jgi:hypothetical protein